MCFRSLGRWGPCASTVLRGGCRGGSSARRPAVRSSRRRCGCRIVRRRDATGIVSLGGRDLAITLAITNTDDEPFTFTAALHTYLAVADLTEARVEGLAGLRYRDHTAGGTEAQQVSAQVDFSREVDRLYLNAPAELRLVEAARTTVIRSAGFPDAVVWNPGAEKCAAMADLEPGDYRRYVCVEAAAVGAPVVLAPGERWQGTQTLVA